MSEQFNDKLPKDEDNGEGRKKIPEIPDGAKVAMTAEKITVFGPDGKPAPEGEIEMSVKCDVANPDGKRTSIQSMNFKGGQQK